MLERLRDAQNAHDAERLAALFAEDYVSSQPLHGGRAFVGRTQVLENWTAVFEGVPDFVSELVSYSIDGSTEWGEWYWHGRHLDGSSVNFPDLTVSGYAFTPEHACASERADRAAPRPASAPRYWPAGPQVSR
jgi:hypothetical protein